MDALPACGEAAMPSSTVRPSPAMTRISSRTTFIYRRAFPLFRFGCIGLFAFIALTTGIARWEPVVLAVPVVMAAVGVVIVRRLVWVLADEVYDCGSHLSVRHGASEQTIPLSNIMNVSATATANPPQITPRLVQTGVHGHEIMFSSKVPFTLSPFTGNAIAEELMVRVDQARANRRH